MTTLNYNSIGTYITLAVVILFLFLAFSHFMNYTKITNEPLSILQSEQPIPEVIENMLAKKQPIIFLYELELWDGVDLLIGYPQDEISEVLKDNKELIKTIKTVYLRPYALSFTKDWIIKLETRQTGWDELPITPIREQSYMHMIANLSGLMVVCLIHPNKINKSGATIHELIKSGFDFKTALANQEQLDDPETAAQNPVNTNANSNKFDYITMPVRPSNMIYIPYGWYYWVYCGQPESYCSYLDIVNQTWFGG
jgi:hypothetical protein